MTPRWGRLHVFTYNVLVNLLLSFVLKFTNSLVGGPLPEIFWATLELLADDL